jgi:hypothetical protein
VVELKFITSLIRHAELVSASTSPHWRLDLWHDGP